MMTGVPGRTNVKSSWSGPRARSKSPAGKLGTQFLNDSMLPATNSITHQHASATSMISMVPNVAISDVFQYATPFHGNLVGTSYASLINQLVGVVTYEWLCTGNAPAALTNMTSQAAQS